MQWGPLWCGKQGTCMWEGYYLLPFHHQTIIICLLNHKYIFPSSVSAVLSDMQLTWQVGLFKLCFVTEDGKKLLLWAVSLYILDLKEQLVKEGGRENNGTRGAYNLGRRGNGEEYGTETKWLKRKMKKTYYSACHTFREDWYELKIFLMFLLSFAVAIFFQSSNNGLNQRSRIILTSGVKEIQSKSIFTPQFFWWSHISSEQAEQRTNQKQWN